MPYSEREKALIRRLAEAHAFISDLRRAAISSKDEYYISITAGIEEKTDKYRKEYSPLFQRYFNNALKRAQDELFRLVTGRRAVPKEKDKDGQGETVSRREKPPDQKEEKPARKEKRKKKPKRRLE